MKGSNKVPPRKSKNPGFGDFGKIGSTIGSQMGSLLGKQLGRVWGKKMAKKYLPGLTMKLAGSLFPGLPTEILPVLLPLFNDSSPFFNNKKKKKQNNTKKNANKNKSPNTKKNASTKNSKNKDKNKRFQFKISPKPS